MAGTRTAPDAAAAANSYCTTVHLIDASGDTFTDNIITLTAPTPAEIEAWAAAYQTATQASVWKISTLTAWTGDKDSDNAEVGQRNSIADGINLLFKNVTTLVTQSPRVIAPVPATMQGNQDIPLLSSTEMTNLIVAYLAILSGFNLESAQFTGRRERKNNPRISV